MYSINPIRLIVLILALSAMQATAQTITNSPYSRYGIGDLYSHSLGHSNAMGGASLAEASHLYVNSANPAANTNLVTQRFVFDVGMDAKYTSTESASASQKNSNVSFSYLAGGFAAKPWWVFSFMFKPYSSVGYKFTDSTHVVTGDHTTYYGETFSGKGGLNEVSISTAFKFLKMFSAGASGSVIFGTTEQIHSITHSALGGNINGGITTANGAVSYNNKYIMHGLKYDLGFRFERSFRSRKDTLTDAFRLSLGAVMGCEARIKAKNELNLLSYNTITGSTGSLQYSQKYDTLSNATLFDGKITLPKSLGLGVSMEFMEQLMINADYRKQDWTSFVMPGVEESTSMRAMQYYGMGMQYVRDRFSSKYYKTVIYRVGIHKTQTYYNINGHGIDEKGFAFGLGLPLRTLLVNVGVDFGKRGTTDNNLYQEKYVLFNASITTHSIWFVKRKFN
ncbi:MAG: outer membrane protein transport protein [Bacteroidales bacterium]|nr:outer membrane protein transport protein [Bacteroidales bacterium]